MLVLLLQLFSLRLILFQMQPELFPVVLSEALRAVLHVLHMFQSVLHVCLRGYKKARVTFANTNVFVFTCTENQMYFQPLKANSEEEFQQIF